MGIANTIQSDCAPLHGMVSSLLQYGIRVKAMRDVTRGGLATVLHEFSVASRKCIHIEEENIPVTAQVQGLCGILGLDPLYMANEGKMVAAVAKEDSQRALAALKSSPYGKNAAIIGEVISGEEGILLMHTRTGGTRILTELYGEGLPRIC
jgi:hydrogenase expression/formation protein HypE